LPEFSRLLSKGRFVRLAAATAATSVMATPFALPARAAETATDQEGPIVVTGVRDTGGYVPKETGAAKIPVAIKDLPQSISVVPAEVLRDQRALSLQDALKNVPGVSFSHGDGQRDQVTIRGFTAIADQYVDGFRDDGLYFRDLSNVERIEVVKGPPPCSTGAARRAGSSTASPRSPTSTS
jgi:catecholate siderophore receptor